MSLIGSHGTWTDASVSVEKVNVRAALTLADAKTINSAYEFLTGSDGANSIWPLMSVEIEKGATFEPATTSTFQQATAVTSTSESAITMPARAVQAIVRFKLPNFIDASVNNNGQGSPMICLVVNGVVVRIDASIVSTNNVTSEFYYDFPPSAVVQISLLSGNVDDADALELSDMINETDQHLALGDSGINISWLHIAEI